ncbi:potassium-transporting ATPase subunit KdpC [Rhodanobacter geophilus]|uniref:Potassium-transporting ATPase KdpC subunit n=1 Tax=Rhodanobacter geophilus TaxID=3162488 RepID=A0ABV3QP58_9GAMM
MTDMNLSFRRLVRPVLVSTVFFMLLTGLGYPLATTAAANLLMPWRAHGSVVQRDGVAVGSAVLGQQFERPEYFHPRPSVTADAPYNAGSSGASNLGPTNRKLIDAVAARVKSYRAENGLAADTPVPVDAVTASASGLDPDISPANAQLQLKRVATQRHMSESQLADLLHAHTSGRLLGLLGEPRVNVLKLNLALDAQQSPAVAGK